MFVESTHAYTEICDVFGAGRVFYYNLVMLPMNETDTVLSNAFFQQAQQTLGNMV